MKYPKIIALFFISLIIVFAIVQINLLPVNGNSSLDNTVPNKIINTENIFADSNLSGITATLDKRLALAKKEKAISEQLDILHKLQIVNYSQFATFNSLDNAEELMKIVEDNKNLIRNSIDLQSYQIDSIILSYKANLENRKLSVFQEPWKTASEIFLWIKKLEEINLNITVKKEKAKIYSQLAYLYWIVEKRQEAYKYYDRLNDSNLDLTLMSSTEKMYFLLNYTETIKVIDGSSEKYISGLNKIATLAKKYLNDFPLGIAYIKIQLASLHFFVGNHERSISLLEDKLNTIEKLPAYFKYLAFDIMGDNMLLMKEYSKSKEYYMKIFSDLGHSLGPNTNIHYLDNVLLKNARVSFRNAGKLDEMAFSLIYNSSVNLFPPYNVINSPKWIDSLIEDNFHIERKFVKSGAIWNALAISELNRYQPGRYQFQYKHGLSYHPYSFYNEPPQPGITLGGGRELNSSQEIGFKIAGKDALFPYFSAILANLIRVQNENTKVKKFWENGSSSPFIVDSLPDRKSPKNAKTTIIEYSYNFKELKPTDLFLYVFNPETDPLKVKPIYRCVNLISSQDSLCSQKSNKITSNEKKLIGEIGFNSYINQQVTNVINCTSENNICESYAAKDSLKKLYQILIQPVSDLLPIDPDEKVVFIPHGSIYSVPFSALMDSTGQYLIEKITPSIAPSIYLLGDATSSYEWQTDLRNKWTFLIMGNPIIAKTLSNLKQLPFAEKEAIEISKLYGADALIGKNATKDIILRKIGDAKLIHIASHGLIDDKDPFNSSIILSPTFDSQEGKLTVSEIPSTANTELVVISACQSGKGKVRNYGVAGLSGQLITAGNPTQVVSLWSVNDQSTSEIMVDFHRNMILGDSKTHALRRAILKTMKTKKYADPYYWAPFVLVGNTK
jgi:CHAT domain-containing protein/tetratricopeptide (TPR) repeat protein